MLKLHVIHVLMTGRFLARRPLIADRDYATSMTSVCLFVCNVGGL